MPYGFARQTEDGIPVLIPIAAVGPPGNTVYVKQGNTMSITVMSSLSYGSCQSLGGFTEDVIPVVPVLDLNTQFTPPFHVVPSPISAAPICGDCNGDGTVRANEITQAIANVFNAPALTLTKAPTSMGFR